MKGDIIVCCLSSFQGKFLSQGWFLISLGPFNPNLWVGFLYINLLTKSAPSKLHPGGISYLLIYTYLARM